MSEQKTVSVHEEVKLLSFRFSWTSCLFPVSESLCRFLSKSWDVKTELKERSNTTYLNPPESTWDLLPPTDSVTNSLLSPGSTDHTHRAQATPTGSVCVLGVSLCVFMWARCHVNFIFILFDLCFSFSHRIIDGLLIGLLWCVAMETREQKLFLEKRFSKVWTRWKADRDQFINCELTAQIQSPWQQVNKEDVEIWTRDDRSLHQ